MSTLSVSIIETPDEFSDLILKTGNTLGPTLIMSSSNDTIFLNGTLNGLTFPELNAAIEYAFVTANDAANVAYAAADTANASASIASFGYLQANTARDLANSAFLQANTARDLANTAVSTGKAIAMAIVFG
jgi:hypothetical protein